MQKHKFTGNNVTGLAWPMKKTWKSLWGVPKESQEEPGASLEDSCCTSSRSTEGLVTSSRMPKVSVVYSVGNHLKPLSIHGFRCTDVEEERSSIVFKQTKEN